MLFNSIEFLSLFLPTVVSIFLLLQRWQRREWAILWLTLSSLFFYGWWNPVYVPLILLSMVVTFVVDRVARRESGG